MSTPEHTDPPIDHDLLHGHGKFLAMTAMGMMVSVVGGVLAAKALKHHDDEPQTTALSADDSADPGH